MNREIKFRGKRADNGEWIFGSLISLHPDGAEIFWLKNATKHGVKTSCDYVIPDTVGQFTGLHDKNGKRIFEGDIVEFMDASQSCTSCGYEYDEVLNTGTIVWCNDYGRWTVSADILSVEVNELFEVYKGKTDFNVIGNIHDNPELI